MGGGSWWGRAGQLGGARRAGRGGAVRHGAWAYGVRRGAWGCLGALGEGKFVQGPGAVASLLGKRGFGNFTPRQCVRVVVQGWFDDVSAASKKATNWLD